MLRSPIFLFKCQVLFQIYTYVYIKCAKVQEENKSRELLEQSESESLNFCTFIATTLFRDSRLKLIKLSRFSRRIFLDKSLENSDGAFLC